MSSKHLLVRRSGRNAWVDPIRLVEFAYDLSLDEDEWRGGLAAAFELGVEGGAGSVSWRYSIHRDQPRIDEIRGGGEAREWLERLVGSFDSSCDARRIAGCGFRSGPAVGSLQAALDALPASDASWRSRIWQGSAKSDFWGLLLPSSATEGVGVGTLTRAMHPGTSSRVANWRRVMHHFWAAAGLRRRLTDSRSASGHSSIWAEHHSLGRSIPVRELLRERVWRGDAARGVPRRRDSEGALALWRSLVAGRHNLVDRFEHDNVRYLVVQRNPGNRVDPRHLTSRQHQVLRLVAQGRSNSEVAAALGLAPTTIATHLTKGMERLGMERRVEVPRYLNIDGHDMDRFALEIGVEVISIGGGARVGSAQLSQGECAVAELAVVGLSDREIASRRGVSTRTVSNQLARTFRKLGVRSRTDLARVFPSPRVQNQPRQRHADAALA